MTLLKSTKFLLTLIFIIAFFLRFLFINFNPPSLTWDEAALGYNAYSIIKTGKDEYGEFLPLIFKSFGDYKPGLYVYLTAPFVAVFGLNEIAVRLPSIILGSLIPIIAYLLVVQILGEKNKNVGIVLAFLLALSPWAINYSRGAWETNVAFFEYLFGSYFLLRARAGNKKYLILSFLVFGLSILTYQSAKIFAILFPLSVLFLERNKIFTNRNKLVVFGCVLFLIGVVALSMADPQARSRLNYLNQFNYQRGDKELNEIKFQEDNKDLFNFYHFEQLEQFETISSRFLNYFSPKFLFIDGPPDSRQGVLSYGMMHLFEFPLILFGLMFFLKINYQFKLFFLFWAIFSIIPAALSRDSVNTVRTLSVVFVLEFLVAVGIVNLFQSLKTKRYLFLLPLILIAVFNFGFYLDKYFVHSRIHGSEYWLYGHKEVVEYIEQNKDKYNKIVFSNVYNEPYIFYLFYTKYDPDKYQKQAKLTLTRGADVGEVERIDNIEFHQFYWPAERGEKGNLYIGGWLELPLQDIDPKQAKHIKDINFLNNTTAFRIVETVK